MPTINGRKLPVIEPDVYDDENGHGFDPLDRFGDAKFKPYRSRWSEVGHPMTDWRA